MSEMKQRPVVVRMTFDYAVLVPKDFTPEQIEFARNESNWCADNALEEMVNLLQRSHKEGVQCVCSQMTFKFVREANDEDVDNFLTSL